jgi:hypothetical protein
MELILADRATKIAKNRFDIMDEMKMLKSRGKKS